jgi:hypothetical protein
MSRQIYLGREPRNIILLNTNPPPRVTPCQKINKRKKKPSVAKAIRCESRPGSQKPNGQSLSRISGRRAFEDSTTCSATVPGRRDQPSPGSSLWHPLSPRVWFVDHRYGAAKLHRPPDHPRPLLCRIRVSSRRRNQDSVPHIPAESEMLAPEQSRLCTRSPPLFPPDN